MLDNTSHIWITGPYIQDCEHVRNLLDVNRSNTHIIRCHHQLRGCYTGTGELLRKIVPDLYQIAPELVIAHNNEILSVAPELGYCMPMSPEIHEAMHAPNIDSFSLKNSDESHNTISHGHPGISRTLCLANGLVTFLQKGFSLRKVKPLTIVFQQFHYADMLDKEFVSVLLRRMKPCDLQIIVETNEEISQSLPDFLITSLNAYTSIRLAEPLSKSVQNTFIQSWHLPLSWQVGLQQLDQLWRGDLEVLINLLNYLDLEILQPEQNVSSIEQVLQYLIPHLSFEAKTSIIKQYIATDGTSENILQSIVYKQANPKMCAIWHDERADYLESLNQWSLSLGAVLFHRLRGQQSNSTKSLILGTAIHYYANMGYYEMIPDLVQYALPLINIEKQMERYWFFMEMAIVTAIAQEQLNKAESLLLEVRVTTNHPYIHSTIAYIMAMLYARYYHGAQRNYHLARGWLQNALVITRLMQIPEEGKKVAIAFYNNGMALIEYREGNLQEAMHLVSFHLEDIRKLENSELHISSITSLLHNRALLYTYRNQFEAALEDYHELLSIEPQYSLYYIERGDIYKRLGQNKQALEDYNNAIRYIFPDPNIYYNRAMLLTSLGDTDKALEDYTYVLELNPHHIHSLINRAALLYENKSFKESSKDIEQGLALKPRDASLLCTKGLIEMEEGKTEQAFSTFSSIIEYEYSFAAAWANRAIIKYEKGDIEGSIEDLCQAILFDKNAEILYNRGFAYQAKQSWQLAISDYSEALKFPDADFQEILYQRGLCYLQIENKKCAYQDFLDHLALGSSPYRDAIHQFELDLPNI